MTDVIQGGPGSNEGMDAQELGTYLLNMGPVQAVQWLQKNLQGIIDNPRLYRRDAILEREIMATAFDIDHSLRTAYHAAGLPQTSIGFMYTTTLAEVFLIPYTPKLNSLPKIRL